MRKPALSNWGVFGEDDDCGTVNYLSEDVVRSAATEIVSGQRFTLNLPLDQPTPRPLPRPSGRPELTKTAHVLDRERNGFVINDDHVILATQGSSQWDAFVHFGVVEEGVDGVFYNGVGRDAVDANGFAHRGSIEGLAQRGIVGRGVLVDIARYVADGGDQPLPLDHVITVEQMKGCLEAEGVNVMPGDILCFRTGWTEKYMSSSHEERHRLMHMVGSDGNPGITGEFAQIAHEQRWAAVGADNLAVEALPMVPDAIGGAHTLMLRNLGIPFAELLMLDNLSKAANSDRRWTFFFVAVPLWIPGGMGSPANAIAIR